MKFPVSPILAAAVLALTVSVRAEEAVCPASKAATASASGECAATECCASQTRTVLLKIKNAREDAKLAQALAKLEGVSAVQTCSESKFTKVNYSGDKVCADKIMAALKESGYKVQARRVSYAVDGMSCGSCSDKLSTALKKVKGVSSASVCSESKVAVVDFDPAKVTGDKVLAAIEGAGYKASEAAN